MKKTILAITSLALLTLTSSAQVSNGLIAYYMLDGNGNDNSSNSFNASSTDNLTYGDDRNSNTVSAGVFASSYLEVDHHSLFHPSSNKITVSAWVNISHLDPDDNLSGSRVSNIIIKGYDTYNTFAYTLRLSSPTTDTTKLRVEFTVKDNNNKGYQALGASYLNYDTWYLLTGTYDGTNLKIYTDCIEAGSNTIPGLTLRTNTDPLRIGRGQNTQYDYPFYGKIDEVRIWDRALSLNEICTISGTGRTHENNITLNIYPNPSGGLFNVGLNTKNTEVNVTDVTGKTVYSNYYKEAGTHHLDLQDLTPGIYFVRVESEEGTKTKKITIQ